MKALYIALFAAMGALVRYLVDLWLNPVFSAFALGTLFVNVIGGFLVGMAIIFFDAFSHFSPALRMGITTGFLGGLTTFSAFSGEVTLLFEKGSGSMGLFVVALHVGGALAATAIGIYTAKVLINAG